MRAKFYVDTVTAHAGGGISVSLLPVKMGNDENKAFWQATPNGELKMFITNFAAIGYFAPGAEYYIDITPAIIVDED